MVLAFNPEEQWAARAAGPGDQLQILSQCLGQGYWLETDYLHACMEIDLIYFSDGGENRSTQRKPLQTWGEHMMQTPHRKVLPQVVIEPMNFLLWGNSANPWSTTPPFENY